MKQLPVNLANKYTLRSLLTNPLYLKKFIRDLYYHQKIAEAISFLVWELFHVLKIFKKTDYIIFEKEDISKQSKDNIIFKELHEPNKILFFNSEVKIEKKLEAWKTVFYL